MHESIVCTYPMLCFVTILIVVTAMTGVTATLICGETMHGGEIHVC